MKLRDTLLCIECEALYTAASHCPQCGSFVSYPLDRALNRSGLSDGLHRGSSSPLGASGLLTLAGAAGGASALQRSA